MRTGLQGRSIQKKNRCFIYIEPKGEVDQKELEQRLHEQLKKIYTDYDNLENMLGIKPLHITLLPAGSFQQYMEGRKKAGADLAHIKPPHMNPTDEEMELLKALSFR